MGITSKYRITGRELIETIDNWERLINFKLNLIGFLEKVMEYQ